MQNKSFYFSSVKNWNEIPDNIREQESFAYFERHLREHLLKLQGPNIFPIRFDAVRHATLLEKLPRYGIDNAELQWIDDYLFNRKQKVIFNNASSCKEEVTCGVP